MPRDNVIGNFPGKSLYAFDVSLNGVTVAIISFVSMLGISGHGANHYWMVVVYFVDSFFLDLDAQNVLQWLVVETWLLTKTLNPATIENSRFELP